MPGVSSTTVGVRPLVRRDVLEHGEQVLRVVIDRADADAAEEIRKRALHRHAVFQQVGNAGGAAAVVLEDEVGALAVAHHVAAANVDVDVLRHRHADHLGPVMLGGEHVLGRDDLFLEDALVGIEVLEEQIQRLHALDQARLDLRPFRIRDDARHEIERENALGALLVAVDGEGDALAQEGGVDRGAALVEFLLVEVLKALEERRVMGPHLALRGKHFVKKIAGLVFVEQGHERKRKN